jgi:rhodanese-related sulfurtransferase
VTRVSIDELLDRARRRLDRIAPAAAASAIADGAALIDIRTEAQIATDGTVPGARVIARNVLEWRLDPECAYRDPEAPALDAHVIVMCNEGYQSSLVAATLQEMGFKRATDLEGGFQAWRAAGLAVAAPQR